MRMSALKCLIYRDLFLARKPLLFNGVLALFMMFFGILVSLSTKYGNLAHVPKDYQDLLGEGLFILSCVLPVYMCAVVGTSVSETMQFECDDKWRRFRLSTPVSEYIFALARYIVLLGAVAVCTGISLVYMWGNSVITGEPVSAQSIAFVLAITFVFLIFSLLMQILIQLLGSADRAGIAMVVVLFPVMFLVMTHFELAEKIPADAGMQFLLELCATYLPHISVIFVVFLVISFVVTAKLYKRREK